MKIRNFTDLRAWKESHKLVLEIYRNSQYFPKEETYGLSSQIRRSAVSVSSNISEGFSRTTKKDKQHFYNMAKSSLTELQNQLLISKDLNYISNKTFQKIAKQTKVVSSLITGLHRSAHNRSD